MKEKLTLDDLKMFLESQIETFEKDFNHSEFGKQAKILHKHYRIILHLLEEANKK